MNTLEPFARPLFFAIQPRFALLAAACLAVPGAALAEPTAAAGAYPVKPVRLLVPYTAGGGTDIMSRALAVRLSERWGQQVVVDNRGGGGTVIGTEIVAHAPADGYTLLSAAPSFVINPTTRPRLPYDTLKDFLPITQVASQSYVLVVHPKVPAQNVREFIALAKARPGVLNFGSTGVGSGSHLAGELFGVTTQTQLTHVAYKGMGPALTDLLGGQTQFVFASIVPVLPHVRGGRLRALASTGAQRAAVMPDLPTVAEAGVPGYQATSWLGLFAPATTSGAIIDKVNADARAALGHADLRERLAADGAEPAGTSARDFDAFIRAEITKWARVIRAAHISMQ